MDNKKLTEITDDLEAAAEADAKALRIFGDCVKHISRAVNLCKQRSRIDDIFFARTDDGGRRRCLDGDFLDEKVQDQIRESLAKILEEFLERYTKETKKEIASRAANRAGKIISLFGEGEENEQ